MMISVRIDRRVGGGGIHVLRADAPLIVNIPLRECDCTGVGMKKSCQASYRPQTRDGERFRGPAAAGVWEPEPAQLNAIIFLFLQVESSFPFISLSRPKYCLINTRSPILLALMTLDWVFFKHLFHRASSFCGGW